MGIRNSIAVAFAAATISLAAPAAAVDRQITQANYEIVYGAMTNNSVYAANIFRVGPESEGKAAVGRTITSTLGGFAWSAGFPGTSIVDRPVFFDGNPADSKVVSAIFGVSQLFNTPDVPTIRDDFDITGLHMTIGVSRSFATTLLEKEFDQVFSDFTFEGRTLREEDFIREVLRTAGYVNGPDRPFEYDESGVPASGPPSNLLFDFGSYLRDKDGTFGEGDFTFVSFTAGKQIGTGTATFAPVATPAVPEAATWAMMILGFGVVGGAMRRRRFLAAGARIA